MPVTLVCTVCGGSYRATPSRAVDSKYCSSACKHAAKGGHARLCEVCGKEFYRPPSSVHNGTPQRFCSRQCAGKGRTPRYLNHPPVMHAQGYRLIWMPGHPRAGHGYVFEHILVAEATIGRAIKRGEEVHHINGVKTDNRPENLQVLTAAEHGRLHMAERGGGAAMRAGKRKEAKE